MNIKQQLKELMMTPSLLKLAVAESLTSGHVQARIGAVSGASNYFLGGVTAYTLVQKVKLLHVNRAAARRVDGVSQRVAVEMAQGALSLFGADLSIATTGYAEPNPALGVKVPMAWWALCHQLPGDKMTVISGLLEFRGAKRIEVQQKVADEVLAVLVAYLQEWRVAQRSEKSNGRKKTRRTMRRVSV